MKTLITVLLLAIGVTSYAQPMKKIKLDSKMKSEAIANISTLLIENYVFEDVAEKVKTQLEANLNSNAYDNIDDPIQFSQKVTNDLQAVTNDKHLRFMYNPQVAADLLKGGGDEETNPVLRKKYEEQARSENYQFKKLEILPGNIGYLDLRGFTDANIAKETGAAAMSFLSNTDAIIFDLRENGGGDPNMVQFLCSYLFEGKVHLNDLYYRKKNETTEYWTHEIVPGKKMPNVDVYVLTSNYTFSGAEEFTYNLKNLKRAVIIGENTGGGANPGGGMRVSDNFIMFVPTGRAINPITKTNWEGTGIAPDIACKKEDALNIALVEINKKFLSRAGTPEEKSKYQWSLDALESKINPVTVTPDLMQKYAGDYGPRKIYFENNELIYERPGVLGKTKLIPIKENYFSLEGRENSRVRFNSDASGTITSLSGIYADGFSEDNPKTN